MTRDKIHPNFITRVWWVESGRDYFNKAGMKASPPQPSSSSSVAAVLAGSPAAQAVVEVVPVPEGSPSAQDEPMPPASPAEEPPTDMPVEELVVGSLGRVP